MKYIKKILKWTFITLTVLMFGLVYMINSAIPNLTPEQEAAKAEDSANAYSVLVAASNIAPSLNDPESLEIIEAVREVNTGTICILYSAKNGFGGRVREGFAVVDGRVSDYSAVCQSGGSYKDYTNYVKWNI